MGRRSRLWFVWLALCALAAVPVSMNGAPVTTRRGGPPAQEETEASTSMHVPPSPRQTPGISVRLDEILRVPKGRGGTVGYRLLTSGFPQDRAYDVVYTGLSTDWKPVVVASKVRPDASGSLKSLETIAFHREDEDAGESVQIEVVSDDDGIYAVDKVFPFPIEISDGPCHVWAEVATPTREGFFLWLDGFQPGEQVQIASADSCDVQKRAHTVGADGRSMVGVLHCGLAGTATFSVSAQSCALTLANDYGQPGRGLRAFLSGHRSRRPDLD